MNMSLGIYKLEQEIKELEKEKIELLMDIPFVKWNKFTSAMEQICKYYLALVHVQNELEILNDLYKPGQEEEKEKRRIELQESLNTIKTEVKPYIEERNEITKDISQDKIKAIQHIYTKIYELEDRKENLEKLENLEFEIE